MGIIAVTTVVLVLVVAVVLAVASYRRHSERARRASASAWLTLQLEADALRSTAEDGPAYLSPQFEQLTGYPRERWNLDRDFWRTLVHPADRARVFAVFDQLGSHTVEYRIVHASGQVVWVRDQTTIVREPDGSLRETGLTIDITAEKELERRVSEAEALSSAAAIGYPVLVRPSFVLGGRGMFIVYGMDELKAVVREAFEVAPGKPVLLDKFLEDAIELDVDAIADGETTVIGGMLEHVEHAGVHSGDAGMVLPPHTLAPAIVEEVRRITHALAKRLRVVGLMNIQFAIKDGVVFTPMPNGTFKRDELSTL